LWGNNTTGYHVVNVLLHAVNAVLVWIVLQRLKIPGAWLAGLVFAIHPVNVATVAWISEQKNTLSMLLYAVTILFYLSFDEKSRWGWYALSLVAFVLALLTKTAVVMLPVVLLGCVWWLRGRVRWKDFLCTVPFFVLSLVMGLVNIWFEYHRASGGQAVRTAGFTSRLAAAGWVPWFYLCKAFLPLNLTVIYPQWHINAARWISYIPGMALVGSFALFGWKRETWGRALLFALGYFVATLFPVLGFFDQPFYRYSLVADHWQYYSIVGVIALAVAAGQRICRRMGERGRDVGVLASVAILVTLGAATWTRTRVYADPQTLWRDNVAKNPNAWLAHNSLGVALMDQGRAQEAVTQYEKALHIKADYAEAHNNLGVALVKEGKLRDAIGHYEQALQINPDYAVAHCNLGAALVDEGMLRDAIRHYEQALQINPDYAVAHYNLGNALHQAGRFDDAIRHYEQAVQINPDYAAAHYNLGVTLTQAGRIPEAMEHLQQAVRIKPDYAEAHYNLGVVLVRLGKTQEAMEHYEQALRIKPGYAEAHNNLGNALARSGRIPEAIGHYEQALRDKPDYPEAQNSLAWLMATRAPPEGGDPARAVTLAERACQLTNNRVPESLDTLAVAYAAAGRFDDAIAAAQKAIGLARASGQTRMVSEIEPRLELYRAGRPYREPVTVTSPHGP
jgi:tetratricopeptide (TPR) repeat protein